MYVVELFSGTKSISHAFERRGHKAFTIDSNPKHEPDMCVDIMELDISKLPEPFQKPRVVWASPPCQCFSVLRISVHWEKRGSLHIPKTGEAERAVSLVKKTMALIKALNPVYWFIENPRAKLRVLPLMRQLPRRTLSYCRYGADYQKPTDVWTNCNVWVDRGCCKPKSSCHAPAPRGSAKGIQGLSNSVVRAKIPEELCNEIVLACEKEPVEQWF